MEMFVLTLITIIYGSILLLTAYLILAEPKDTTVSEQEWQDYLKQFGK